ncbi:MAG: uracil-DNA glycosylase [Gammaproteobacteria bacterium]
MPGSPDNRLQQAYLKAMGIHCWVSRNAGPDSGAIEEAVITASPVVKSPAEIQPDKLLAPDWQTLEQQVQTCTRCELHTSRTQTVFGVGDRNTDWLIIGEAPGHDEDLQGEPFVGRAGQLLTAMLKAIGLQRQQVFIANILKCRPPNNRDPSAEEVSCCEAYLAQQIDLIQPKIILAVGRIAAQNLLKTDTPIGKLRSQIHHYGKSDIPVIATYHPAYLLRSPLEKRKAWDDLQLARNIINQKI